MFDYVANGQMSMFDFIKTEEPQAEPKPQKDKEIYKSIKVSEMEVMQERNFVEICTDSRICISATVKLLKGNIVYWNEWYTYPFLNVYMSQAEAEKQYNEHLNNIMSRLTQPPRFEVDTPVELQDMYLCVNGNWSCEDYSFYNGPVEK